MGIAEAFDTLHTKAAGFRNSARAAGSRSAGSPYGAATQTYDSVFSQNSSHADRQYRTAKENIPYTAIRPIAVKVADQAVRVGYKPQRQEGKTVAGRMRTKDLFLVPDFIRKEIAEGLEIDNSHEFVDIMESPNPFMSGWALQYCTAFSVQATGKSFWWLDQRPVQDRLSPRLQIWYLPTTWVTAIPDEKSPFARWKVLPPGVDESKAEFVDGRDMAYFAYPDPSDPLSAFSSLQSQARAVNTDDEIQKSQYATMQNAGKPGMVLVAGHHPAPPGMTGQGPRVEFTPEQRKQLIESIRLAYSGVVRHGDPLILDAMIEDAHPYTRTPAELDFLNGSKLTKARIMQGIGTNPIVAGEIEGANRASAVMADRNFYNLVVNPLISLMSSTMTQAIGPRYSAPETGRKLYVYLEKAQADDEELKLQKLEVAAQYQAIRRDELREALDLEPVGGEEGQAWAAPPQPPKPEPGQDGKSGPAGVGAKQKPKPSNPAGGSAANANTRGKRSFSAGKRRGARK